MTDSNIQIKILCVVLGGGGEVGIRKKQNNPRNLTNFQNSN